MKKMIFTAWIFAFVFFILPLSSLGGGVSERQEGEQHLSAEYQNLEAELPIVGKVSAEKAVLDITWEGKENKVVTPSNRHNHHAKVENADGKITLIGVQASIGYIPILTIELEIESGSINEHGTGEHTDPTTANVFLRAKSVNLNIPLIGSFSLGHTLVKIKNGKLQFVKSEVFPAPRRSKIHRTTLANIKSKQ